MTKYLDLADAALYCCQAKKTLGKKARDGEIDFYKISPKKILFDVAELDRYIRDSSLANKTKDRLKASSFPLVEGDSENVNGVATMFRNSARNAATCALDLAVRAGFKRAATVAGQLLELIKTEEPDPVRIKAELAKFKKEFSQPSTAETQKG